MASGSITQLAPPPFDSDLNPSQYTLLNNNETYSMMDSTPTLVHFEPLDLVFDRNSVISATLYFRTTPMYKITSNSAVTRITLYDLKEQRMVAMIKRRDFWPDVVVLPHRRQKSMRIKKWLKRSKRPGTEPTACLRTQSENYIWRSSDTYRFALYPENQSVEIPIAYSKSLGDPQTLGLVIRTEAYDVWIEIIVSFLVLEHKLRMKEKARQANTSYGISGHFVMMG